MVKVIRSLQQLLPPLLGVSSSCQSKLTALGEVNPPRIAVIRPVK